MSKFWKTYSGHYSGSKDGAYSNFKRLLWRFYIAWYDSVRHGSVRLGLRFHCSLVPLYSGRDYLHVALPWLLKYFLILRRSIKLLLDPLLSYPREDSLFFLNRQRHFLFVKKGVLIQNSCVRSFARCAYLNLAGLFCLEVQ